MMALWEQAEAERGRIREVKNERLQAIRKLAGLTGYGDEMDSGDRVGGIGGATLSDAQTPGPDVQP
jgi:hypothetical protein